MISLLNNIKERYKALCRGERKIAGTPMRGRCFEKKHQDAGEGSPVQIKATPTLEVVKMTIVRKDGTREEIK